MSPSGHYKSLPTLENAVDLRSVPHHRHVSYHPFVQRLRLAVVFDYFAVTGLDIDGYRIGSGHSTDSDVPPAFLEAYYSSGMLAIDPFLKASLNARDVVIEEEVYRQTPPPPRLKELAETFGVHNRTLFPLRRGRIIYGAVTFSRRTPFTPDEIAFLMATAEVMHRVIAGPIMEKFAAQSLKLSDGEIACMRLASDGKTTDQIAAASGYTPDTVNSYVKSAIKKLGADNRVHAIAEAIRRGLIP